MRRLIALDELLQPLLHAVEPLAPVALPLEQAAGLSLASDLVAPAALPAKNIALRAGLAVSSLELVGASQHSPVMLPRRPRSVEVGEVLPPGCDAILDFAAVSAVGSLVEVMETVEPGTHVRMTGHDLSAGHILAKVGEFISAEVILAAKLAGMSHALVRVPTARIEIEAGPQTDWLRRRLEASGVLEKPKGEHVDIVFMPVGDVGPRLALIPGEDAFIRRKPDRTIEIMLPDRFDALVGSWCALVLPIIAKITNIPLAGLPIELSRKITSTVGMSEIALLRRKDGKAHPLAVGDLILAAIAAADAFAIVPAGSEGLASGALIDAIALDNPFEPQRGLT